MPNRPWPPAGIPVDPSFFPPPESAVLWRTPGLLAFLHRRERRLAYRCHACPACDRHLVSRVSDDEQEQLLAGSRELVDVLTKDTLWVVDVAGDRPFGAWVVDARDVPGWAMPPRGVRMHAPGRR